MYANVHLRGNEALLQLAEFLDQLDHLVAFERGQRDAGNAPVQSRHVHVRPEQPNVSLLVLVRLHALERLEGVVEDARRGVQAEVLVRCDPGVHPAIGRGPFEAQHVIGEGAAENQILVVKSLLRGGCLLDLQL